MRKRDRLKALKELLLDLHKEISELAPILSGVRSFKNGVSKDVLKRIQALCSLSNTASRELKHNFCEDCGALPIWERNTQFSGKFIFCDKCAREHPDFMNEGLGDTFFWRKIKMPPKTKR